MIVLADTDLDSVVNFLTSITNEPCVWKISTVYVQEAIKKKFMQLYKERKVKDSMDVESILTVFRFKEELPSKIGYHTDAISIWTENVSAAKSFVMNMLVFTLNIPIIKQIIFPQNPIGTKLLFLRFHLPGLIHMANSGQELRFVQMQNFVARQLEHLNWHLISTQGRGKNLNFFMTVRGRNRKVKNTGLIVTETRGLRHQSMLMQMIK